jgi:hypothetical protein
LKSEEERELVAAIVKMTHEIHEEELVTKGNELRQVGYSPQSVSFYLCDCKRDNTIKSLQARIDSLQTSLARHLKAEECASSSREFTY